LKINTKSILYGTLVLTIANFIVRLMGFAYRVVLSRVIGPQGMGLVQLVSPVFHIAITLTVAGLPVAVSRLVSEKKAKGDVKAVQRTLQLALLLAASISIIIVTAALLNLDFLTDKIIKDSRTKAALFILLPSIIFHKPGSNPKRLFLWN
jgi:stage V sporulation protein B